VNSAPPPAFQPLTLGELLDRAIRLYRRHFATFVGIIAVMQIPLSLVGLIVSLLTFGGLADRLSAPARPVDNDPFSVLGPEYFVGLAGSLVLSFVWLVLIGGVATAATTRAIADSYLGQPVGILEAYRRISRAWPTLVVALVVAAILYLGLVIWFIVPCVGWATGLGLLIFFAAVVMPLIAPIVVLEKRPALESIRRAWDLGRRRFWWVLGFVVVLFLFGQLIVSGPIALLSFVFQFLMQDALRSGDTGALFILQTVTQSFATRGRFKRRSGVSSCASCRAAVPGWRSTMRSQQPVG